MLPDKYKTARRRAVFKFVQSVCETRQKAGKLLCRAF